jgi:outer membrane protein TolC/preprotein translocase subunit SecF
VPQVNVQLFNTDFRGNLQRRATDNFGNPIENPTADWNYFSRTTQALSLAWSFQGRSLFDTHRRQSLVNRDRDLARGAALSGLQIEVQRRYLDALEQMELMRAEEELIEARRVDQQVASRLFSLAIRTRVDVLNAELAVEQQALAHRRQQGSFDRALLALRTTLGADGPGELVLSDEPLPIFDPAGLDADGLVRRALETNPELRRADVAVRQASLGVAEQRNQWWPEVSMGFNLVRMAQQPRGGAFFDVSFDEDLDRSFFLQLSLPVFNGFFANRRDAERAAVEFDNQREADREARLAVEERVRGARMELDNQWETLRLAERSLEIAGRGAPPGAGGVPPRNALVRGPEGELRPGSRDPPPGDRRAVRLRRRAARPRGGRGRVGSTRGHRTVRPGFLTMSIPSVSTRRPVAVWMLFLGIVLLGAISYVRLPIDLLPDVSYPRLVVYTLYPEVAPAEVERLVTERVEAAAAAVPGVERVTSTSRYGVSLVTLRFAWGTDMDFAMLNVRERMDNVRGGLPQSVSRPVILRVDPESEPVMTLSVVGGDDLWATKEFAETVFRRRLEQLDGVAQAAVAGGLDREIQVEVNPSAIDAYGLSLAEIATALDRANVSAPGGTILQGRYRYPLRTLGEFRSVQEIGDVVIARRPVGGGGAGGGGSGAGEAQVDASGYQVIRLRDIARVIDGFAEREAIARYGGAESVGVLVFKESGANTVRVAESVAEIIEQLGSEYPDFHVDIAGDQADFIAASISNVVQALVLGGILAFLVLFLFLRDSRYPFAIALAIPISVVATFALMDAAGVSLNIMSLGGLALGVGMLVDNSIIVLENIFRHREELGRNAVEAAAAGAEEVQSAITASTLTTISVFGPIIYVEGVAGELFKDLSLAVAFSLLASLLVALTLLPSLAARFGGVPWWTTRRRGTWTRFRPGGSRRPRASRGPYCSHRSGRSPGSAASPASSSSSGDGRSGSARAGLRTAPARVRPGIRSIRRPVSRGARVVARSPRAGVGGLLRSARADGRGRHDPPTRSPALRRSGRLHGAARARRGHLARGDLRGGGYHRGGRARRRRHRGGVQHRRPRCPRVRHGRPCRRIAHGHHRGPHASGWRHRRGSG